MSKKISSTMMTQHPDSAAKYVPIQDEVNEAINGLKPMPEGLGLEEIMIDFEGKLTPYHQTAQIVMGLLENGLTPGKDVFVTPRVANARKETAFRQIMAFLSITETIVGAKEFSELQSVVEVILPMVSSAEELIKVKKRIDSVAKLAVDEFGMKENRNLLQLIPLIEEVPELVKIDDIINDFVRELRKNDYPLDYLRFMLGRSDPALSYGNVSAVLANRIALSKSYKAGENLGIDIYPIFGGGALPFRGHVTLENIHNVLETYPGLKTITIQSGIRYDQSSDKLNDMVKIIQEELPQSKPHFYTDEEYQQIYNYIGIFTSTYLDVFFKISPTVAKLSDFMPRQRDRLARKSGLGYARDIARPKDIASFVNDAEIKAELSKFNTEIELALPRAITFTASLYSIGLPPVFLGTGRGLKKLKGKWGEKGLNDFLKEYPSIKADLEFAIKYVNLKNLRRFFPDDSIKYIEEDINYCCEQFNLSLPAEEDIQSNLYHILMDSTLGVLFHLEKAADISRPHEIELLQNWLKEMGGIRGSLG
ncbi:phosphoenolpyruvate carboxylase [Natronospora cellulosivora (SeqCode)]